MTTAIFPDLKSDLRLQFPEFVDLSGDRFFEFCAANRDARIERSADGEVIIMPPADSETGLQNSELNRQLGNWAKQDGTGLVFDSSTGFELPNGATRSPDAAWITRSKVKVALGKKGFLKLCPEFVVELHSSSDSLVKLKAKMQEYVANGARLGWLIDPREKTAYVYRPGCGVEEFPRSATLEGDPLLKGWKFELESIWAEHLSG